MIDVIRSDYHTATMGKPRTVKVFSERVAESLADREMGQVDLARELEMSRQSVHRILKERRDPPLSLACEIADALGESLDWLTGRTNNRHPSG